LTRGRQALSDNVNNEGGQEMPSPPHKRCFDPEDWEGDPEQLIGHEDVLDYGDARLCDQVVSSKQEAFTTGLFLASQSRLSPDGR
jgi:hypothetical protein